MPFSQRPTGPVTGGEGGVQEENGPQVNKFEQGSCVPLDLSPGNPLSIERQDNRQTVRQIQLKYYLTVNYAYNL